MQILVTGATGFLGTHLVEALVARGHTVRAVVRPSSNTEHLARLGATWVVASLEGGGGLAEAVVGVDAVVHAAGGGQAASLEVLDAQNHGSTCQILDALVASGQPLQRFVLVSSLAASGPSSDGRPRPVDVEPAPISDYGRSKVRAEAATLARRDAFPVSILRPPGVYGPGDTRLLGLFRAASRGLLPVVGRGHSASFVYGSDCAAAIVAMLERPHDSGAIYTVCDGGAHATESLARAVATAVSRRGRLVRIPAALLPPAAAVSRLVAALRGRPNILGPDKVRELRQRHWVCDHERIERELGWKPEVPLDEGLAQTAAWYRQQGLLPS
ncbi:MAG: NAD(P)-dependent oxidoreductase [Myxococcota bacterium]